MNLLLAGKEAEARRAVDAVGADPQQGTVWSGAAVGYWLNGKAHLGDSDVFAAYGSLRTYVPEPGAVMTAGEVIFLKGSIEALILAGEKEEAAKLYPLLRGFLESRASLVGFTFGLHERFAGMAAAAAEDWVNAERHYEQAFELAENLPHRVDQARVRFWYARMLLDRDGPGDHERAHQLLAEARTRSESMGMRGLVEWIDTLSAEHSST